MHLLQKWLESDQNYKQGIDLYESFGGSETWLKTLKKLGETTFSRVELYKRIDELLTNIEKAFIPKEKKIFTREVKATNRENKPLWYKQIEEKRKENHKEANRIHHSLVLHVESMLTEKIPVVTSGKDVIFGLREKWEDIDGAWKTTDKYDSDGEMPTEKVITKAEVKLDINHAADMRRTLKTYLAPSYLARKPEAVREQFKKETEAKLEAINQLITENESIIYLR
jgi:hypothetical protein